MLNTARIAKNTIFLYLRMVLVLAANFLAVRVLLEVLGVDDYGLFNLIVGLVTLFTLLNGAMMSTVQRFLCFELGRATSKMSPPPVDATPPSRQNRPSNSAVHLLSRPTFSSSPSSTRLIFTLCFWLFVALSLLIFLASELLAPANLLPYSFSLLPWTLNIPPARFHSAQIVYQLSILVMVFKTMQIPYTALIVSYERMNAFAKISIVEAVLTLAAAYALKLLPSSFFLHTSNLIVYSVLYAVSQGIVCLTYAIYCRRHFAEGHLISLFGRGTRPACPQSEPTNSTVHLLSPPTFSLLRSLSSFFSWSILGAIANMLKQQGLNVLLNLFFGVAFNATWAVANKVGAAVNQLIVNFQQAFNPQIVKLWAEEDKRPFFDLLISSSKFSFLLMWLFALPLMAWSEFFLGIWLKGELPPQLVLFVNLTVVYLLFDALSGPLWMAVNATGRIAGYQIQVSLISGSAFALSWAAFALGAPAVSVVMINAAVNAANLLYRVLYLRHLIAFPSAEYVKRVLVPVGLVALFGGGVATVPVLYECVILPKLLVLASVALADAGIVILFGLSSRERRFAFERIGRIVRRCK